ncbi:hypothetical protein [Actinoplanes sp. M2I2]|uniref:hypothetical protein n=1 Tax=Actinoplanes sp. M2I2 TaxID=1734444 RepID=UPI002021EE3D|nr:hypothetical protein [Actinoplanes sp. M2I2]
MGAVLPVGACAAREHRGPGRAGWREVPGGPLGPREQTLALWTGREVLLVGGSDAPPCPPNADCPDDPTPLADGAALEPVTGRWRTIAASPVPLKGGQGVVLGSKAYVLPHRAERELLVHDVERDSWSRLRAPFDPQAGYQLVAAGERLVAYRGSDEDGAAPDFLLDPATARWSALPDDPLGAAFDRAMAWTGRELLLFDHELIPNPGVDGPPLVRAATLDVDKGSWRRLPELPMLSTGPWIVAGDSLVNPALGGADGGRVGNWGRTYPYGGRVEIATGAWSPLPDPPAGEALGSGARAGGTALYPSLAEWVLDTGSGTWQRVPPPPGDDLSGYAVVAAGADLVIFGGASPSGTLVGVTRVWTP